MAYVGYEHLLLEQRGYALLVTINRPEVRNALAPQTYGELKRMTHEAAADPAVRAVIITGAGEKAFASGADIRSLRERTALQGVTSLSQEALSAIEDLPKPVIAAIDGYALGGGCELAMVCDMRVATDRSRFGLPEVTLGIMPGAGGTQRLTRLVGLGMAKELILTGAIISAADGKQIGLVNRVVPPGDHISIALSLAELVAGRAPLAVQMAKAAIQMGQDVDLRSGLAIERLSQALLYGTEDKLEGTTAFLEKRPAKFQGR
jgi:enoyl-CoA hydratase